MPWRISPTLLKNGHQNCSVSVQVFEDVQSNPTFFLQRIMISRKEIDPPDSRNCWPCLARAGRGQVNFRTRAATWRSLLMLVTDIVQYERFVPVPYNIRQCMLAQYPRCVNRSRQTANWWVTASRVCLCVCVCVWQAFTKLLLKHEEDFQLKDIRFLTRKIFRYFCL